MPATPPLPPANIVPIPNSESARLVDPGNSKPQAASKEMPIEARRLGGGRFLVLVELGGQISVLFLAKLFMILFIRKPFSFCDPRLIKCAASPARRSFAALRPGRYGRLTQVTPHRQLFSFTDNCSFTCTSAFPSRFAPNKLENFCRRLGAVVLRRSDVGRKLPDKAAVPWLTGAPPTAFPQPRSPQTTARAGDGEPLRYSLHTAHGPPGRTAVHLGSSCGRTWPHRGTSRGCRV